MVIKRDPSEDVIDFAIREFLEKKGWKTAYYSPPSGSWSIIEFELNKVKYRSFSPRDMKRPDLLMYKLINNKLNFIIIESKRIVPLFNKKNIEIYIKQMKEYMNSIFKMKYRHKKENNYWIDWNQRITNIDKFDKEISICFIAGSKRKSSEWKNNLLKFKQLIVPFNRKGVFGVLISTDWDNLICYLQVIGKIEEQIKKDLPDNKELNIKY